MLIEIFDREFVETQEATGMRVLAQFRDLERPDYFVWVRGFADMEARKRALTEFYTGPAWKAHGRQAAGTMIDSDNVLLLHAVDPSGGFEKLPATRAPAGATTPASSLVSATVYQLHADAANTYPPQQLRLQPTARSLLR